VELPQECLQIVLQHSVRVLDIVIVAPGTDGDVPEYVDSLVEWREMCGLCKSAVKYILGEVASALKTDCLPAVWQVAELAQAKLKATEHATSQGEEVTAAGHALDVCPACHALLPGYNSCTVMSCVHAATQAYADASLR
jgi:hypothetical protein